MAKNFLSSVYSSLRHSEHANIYLTPATCVNIMRKFIYLFIYLFNFPIAWFSTQNESEWMNERTDKVGREGMNEWLNERMNGRSGGRTDGRTGGRASEGGNEWMNEWMNERAIEREREIERTKEQVSEGGSEGVSNWFREGVNEFIGGYKVDFCKFKRCSTFNYCTAIQTNKDGQNMFWLESV